MKKNSKKKMAKKERENCVITPRNEKKNVQKKKITKEKKIKT